LAFIKQLAREITVSIEVMIKRKIKQGPQAAKLVPLILQLRALATYQPGYICGRTLYNVENPEDCVVVSKWQSLEDWYNWMKSSQRKQIQDKIDVLSHEETEYSIYAPMVVKER
jgi:heme-degrading monooxygenase HmoA